MFDMLTQRICDSHVENETNEISVVLDTDDFHMAMLIYSKAMKCLFLKWKFYGLWFISLMCYHIAMFLVKHDIVVNIKV